MIMCVLLCYPVSICIYYQQGVLFLVFVRKANKGIKTKDNLVLSTTIEAPPEGVGAGGSDYMEVSTQTQYPGARLGNYWKVWENFKVHPRVVLVLKQGYCLPFKQKPPLARYPTIKSSYSDPVKQKALLESVQKMVQKRAVVPVQNKNSLGFYSRLFLVPKPENKWRPVIDLSVVNTFLHVPTFKMETAEVIRASLQAGEWVASIDLTDAYFHVPIHQKFQKYLRFHVQGQAYQFRALPFGIATAPLEFTRVVKEVKFIALSQGVRIHQYLDDWLVRSKDPESCARDVQKLLNLIEKLGWIVNLKKSELKPTQDLEFLGYRFNLPEGLVYPNQKKLDKLRILAVSIFQGLSTTPRKLMSQIGVMAYMEKTVPLGRIHMRPFQWFLKTNWHCPQSLDKVVPISVDKGPSGLVDGSSELTQGFNLHQKEHNMLMFTDASEKGWGAHLNNCTVSGVWQLSEKDLHINILELKAVFLALKHFQGQLRQKIVLVSSDNSTVVSYINKEGGTHSFEMCALMWRILAWSNAREIHIRARHIPGNLNVIADSLSRRDKAIQTEWSLHPQVFQEICQVWHKPMVDLFATSLNAKLPTYVSPVPDDKAWQIDALNISWEALDAYAFCPVAILPQLVQKMITYRCRVIGFGIWWNCQPGFH